jgi:MOSC domain-containing protein YiiM
MPHSQSGITRATIVSLNRSNGAVPKLPVAEARVTTRGLEGDRQRDLKHHGGPDRALCLYSLECIEALRREGHPIAPGSIGENVTIAGLAWERVTPGARLRLGEVEVEVTAFTEPCNTIRFSFRDRKSIRVSEAAAPGWSRVYVRVLREGALRVGDVVELVELAAR